MDNITLINTIITQLDQLSVQGAKNMSLVLQCIQELATLKGNLENVQDKSE